MTHGTDFTPLM